MIYRIIVFVFTLFIVACTSKNNIPIPKKPIKKEVMENILYDLAILQALKSYSPEVLTKNNINSKTYIYQKYKIDSLQLVQNNLYFASNTEEYAKMFEKVVEKIQKQKSNIDAIILKEITLKTKKIRDSMQKNSKKAKEKPKSKIIISG
jgi:Fe2+ transport system protein B